MRLGSGLGGVHPVSLRKVSLDGPTRYGALSRFVWRLSDRLTRHASEQHARLHDALSEHVERASIELEQSRDRLEEVTSKLRELERLVGQASLRRTIFNDAAGELVLGRFRPVVGPFLAHTDGAAPLTTVDCTVGRLVLPTFDRFVLPSLQSSGQWEPIETEFISRWLQPGMTAINVGAHVGYTTLVMARAVGPTGRVLSLEPEPLNFSLLDANVTNNGASNVIPIHSAAGDRTGTITLQRSPDNSGDHRTAPHPVGIAEVAVPIVTLDELIPASAHVDFMSIDAQGFDHRVVRGAHDVIVRSRPAILVEFWPAGILELGERPAEIVDEYRLLGYGVQVLSSSADTTSLPSDEIVDLALSDGDHVTLALLPTPT